MLHVGAVFLHIHTVNMENKYILWEKAIRLVSGKPHCVSLSVTTLFQEAEGHTQQQHNVVFM